MTTTAAIEKEPNVARPLRELVPMIRHELELGQSAGLEHYQRAGAMLLEAKDQIEPQEWKGWLKRNFKLSYSTAVNYIRLAKVTQKKRRLSFTSMEEIVRPNRENQPHRAWQEPVRLAINKLDIERMNQERQNREREERLTRELALRLIDIGFRALAEKLHPDKGGSAEAMTRLNRVRDLLKRSI